MHSFNPCFSGSCSRMLSYIWLAIGSDVSILVLVDLARELWICGQTNTMQNFLFQSLFQWILLANKDNQDLNYPTRGLCFNPCFSGSCSRMNLNVLKQNFRICFNPCFSGSCSRILLLHQLHFSIISFNPCFSGSCSRMHSSGSKPRWKVVFQSLFQWILLANDQELFHQRHRQQFQSLFQWILLANLFLIVMESMFRPRFNPCFSGSCSRIIPHSPRRKRHHLSFNPCFSGSCSRILK